MSIKKAEVRIEGLSPLLMHRFPLEEVTAIEKKTPEEQAEIAAYRVSEERENAGELYVPGVAIWRAIINGAAYSKGKGRATLAKPAAACVIVEPEYCLLGTRVFAIDSRAVVIKSTGGRIVRHRPRFDEWAVEFRMEWDDELLKDKEARQIVDDAGKRVGLLDFRPEKKGPFGRFVVTEWKVL